MGFKLNIIYFLIALSVGLLYVYLFTPEKKVIIRYPTPSNAGKIKYKDEKGECYEYKSNNIKCPDDMSDVKFSDG